MTNGPDRDHLSFYVFCCSMERLVNQVEKAFRLLNISWSTAAFRERTRKFLAVSR